MEMTEADPKGLVRESYKIEGITMGECRSIFIDWVLSLPAVANAPDFLRALLAHYGPANPEPSDDASADRGPDRARAAQTPGRAGRALR